MANQSRSIRQFLERFCWPALIVALNCVAFAPVVHNQFVTWDDRGLILENPNIRGLGWDQIRWMFTTYYMGSYPPLTWLSYAIDYRIWGLNPLGFHLTNVVIHVANALIFYRVAVGLFARACSWSSDRVRFGAAVAALLFAVHPLRVESVVWAAERRDVLSGFFFLLSLEFYVRFRNREETSRRPWVWYGASLLACAASLFSKATAVGLPLILWALDVFPFCRYGTENKRWFGSVTGRNLFEKLPFVALAGLVTIVAFRAQSQGGCVLPLSVHGPLSRFVQSGFGFCFYLWKSLVPTDLTPLVPLPSQVVLLDSPYVGFGVVGWSVFLLLLFLGRRWPTVTTVVICYVVLLLPVVGLVQIGTQLVADRYSYLSCLGFAVLGGALAVKLSSEQRLFGTGAYALSLTATGTVLLTLCVLTRHQVRLWESEITLWSRAVQIHPNSATAHHNLGCAMIDRGQVRESIIHFDRALDLEPSAADTNLELGKALFKQGNWLRAAANFESALALKPDDAESWNYAGAANLNLQRLEKATLAFQIAIKLKPTNGMFFYNLGRAQIMSGNATGALESWHRALELMPESPRVLETLAWHLATSPDDSVRNGPEALRLAERACANTMYQDAGCMNALAAAFAELGRFQDASRLAQQAIEVARATQRTQLAGEIEAQLKFYQSERPYREDATNAILR